MPCPFRRTSQRLGKATNSDTADRFRRLFSKKVCRSDLLHKKPRRLGLDPGNDQENPLVTHQPERGPPYRLCLDGYCHHGDPACADLPLGDLSSAQATAAGLPQPYAIGMSWPKKVRPAPATFVTGDRPAGWRRPTTVKCQSVQTSGNPNPVVCFVHTASCRFRWPPERRFIPAPYLPKFGEN
jgi:hypothetical protein